MRRRPGSGPAAVSQISPATMSALLAAQSQVHDGIDGASASTSRSDALKDLFSQIDADGDGKLSKSEFENALGAGGTNLKQADNVFGKLDKDGDGSVSLDEMMSALKGKVHRHHHQVGESGDATDPAIPIRCCRPCRAHRSTSRHQQRRLGHDVADLCRRLQGDDDVGRGNVSIQRRDIVLQFHRADDPAPGAGRFHPPRPHRFRSAPDHRETARSRRNATLAEAVLPRR